MSSSGKLIYAIVDDISRYSRDKYERILVELNLYDLHRLHNPEEGYAKILVKKEFIRTTIEEKGFEPLLVTLHENGMLSPKTLKLLSDSGYELLDKQNNHKIDKNNSSESNTLPSAPVLKKVVQKPEVVVKKSSKIKSVNGIFQNIRWEIISVAISVIGIFISIMIYFLETEKREIELNIIEIKEVFYLDTSIPNGFQVFYNNDIVSSLTMIRFKIWNRGSVDILANDFIKPIKFTMTSKARIIKVNIVDSFPSNIDVEIKTDESSIEISPTLLNRDDYVVIDTYILDLPKSSLQKPFNVNGRITGVKNITVINSVTDKGFANFIINLNLSLTTQLFILVAFLILTIYLGARFYSRGVIYKAVKRGVKE